MTLDRPVHAPKTADGGTANEAGVVYVYRVKARTNTPTGMRPRLGAYALARRPVRLRPGRPSGGQLCPRLVRLSEVGPGPGAWGSLSYETGRTGNQTE